MVLGRALWLLGAGVAVGLAAGWALARSVSAFLFGIDARAWPVYVAAAALLVLAGLAAAAIPARRAARVNPISVLR
jgi:ABC-type antimicrobial peptide transport system permease subunit